MVNAFKVSYPKKTGKIAVFSEKTHTNFFSFCLKVLETKKHNLLDYQYIVIPINNKKYKK